MIPIKDLSRADNPRPRAGGLAKTQKHTHAAHSAVTHTRGLPPSLPPSLPPGVGASPAIVGGGGARAAVDPPAWLVSHRADFDCFGEREGGDQWMDG